jgi:hypothetical protein
MRYSAVLACAGLLLSQAASAQSAFVTNSVQQTLNVNDPLNHTYQQAASTSCSLAGVCELSFPAMTHKTLLLHVSCFLVENGQTPPTQVAVLVNGPGGTATQNQLPFFADGQNANVGGDYNFSINSDTYLIYTRGEIPQVAVVTSGVSAANFSCTISGYHN